MNEKDEHVILKGTLQHDVMTSVADLCEDDNKYKC